MKLKEVHPDIERYLAEDCYCPNEVYSVDGFFFQYVFADAECKVIGTWHRDIDDVAFVVTASGKNHDHPILLNIWHKDGKVICMERYEYSEENMRNIVKLWNGEIKRVRVTEADDLTKSVSEVLSAADAILAD